MLNAELRSKIDKLWTDFWTGGITNPFTVIEQITFLMFARMLDIKESNNERKFQQINQQYPNPIFKNNEQHFRWKSLKQISDPQKLLVTVRDEVFPHFKRAIQNGSTFSEYMKDAQLMIVKPSLLVMAVETIDALPLQKGDTKGDLYEYLLSKLQTSGIAGQFRTPRHIIQMMVELIDPKPKDRICDPACGTGGFLFESLLYINKKFTSPEFVETREDGSKFYPGDLLFDHNEHIQKELLTGFDFDATMLRIAAMNLMLHGIDNPQIHNQDSLSGRFIERFPKYAENSFNIILANPPFKGSLDAEDVEPSLIAKVKTKKTELLFNFLILRMLTLGGKAAVIVPDGVLFGASKAHVALREELIENNQLEAVISLPSGVFKPYAGVSTGILIFTKGGSTKNVWYYNVENDGFSLDDKRQPIKENDLPDVIEQYKKRDESKKIDRSAKSFFVSADEIRENKYDLSISRYKEIKYKELEYDKPEFIINKITSLENEINKDIAEIKELINNG
ncbi:MAG: SAM-dependent DNA methyltransferase [Ignavibacteriae bacterium]|nr:SAM-dependent DNA methyltransferase [Ignavibacteriota bacterium]